MYPNDQIDKNENSSRVCPYADAFGTCTLAAQPGADRRWLHAIDVPTCT